MQICDRGTRKRHAKCHAAVDEALSAKQNEHFTMCVDTYQAVPVLKKTDRGAQIPVHAEWLPDDNKFTRKGWYISFCDPTLPEARDWELDEVATPQPTNLPVDDDKGSKPEMSEDDMFNLDDFEDLDLE